MVAEEMGVQRHQGCPQFLSVSGKLLSHPPPSLSDILLVAAVAGEEIDHTLRTAVESSVDQMCRLVGRQDDIVRAEE